MNKPYTFVFFGIVGSGKGTQIELMQKYLKEKDQTTSITYAYPGNEYRKITSNPESATGAIVKGKLERGELQADVITVSIFNHILIDNLKKDDVIIADGYPRTIVQAEALEEIMKYYGRSQVAIIYIEVGKEEATKRMKLRARSDDTDEGIARRFDEYVNNVVPAMNYFNGKPGYALHAINGEQTIEQVHADIIKALGI